MGRPASDSVLRTPKRDAPGSAEQPKDARRGQRLDERVLAIPVALFVLALAVPISVEIGGMRLSLYRVVLLATLPFLILRWLGGHAGPLRVADLTVILLALWAMTAFGVHHGASTAIEAGGIFFVETAGAYFMGRVLIRSSAALRATARLLFYIMLFIAPFAVIEALTGRNILLEVASLIGDVPPTRRGDGERLGLTRVQGPFDHSILFGVFCGTAISLAFYVVGYGKSLLRRLAGTLAVFVTAALSLSSGPLAGMMMQLYLITWDMVFARLKSRWTILAVLAGLAYLVVELNSQRSASEIFISYFALNAGTAWARLHIWNFGTASILQNPLFGVGLNEWDRPYWLGSSLDMFWIVPGVRHGIPAMALMLISFFAVYLPMVVRRGLDDLQHHCRLGLLLSLSGLFVMGWTVHYWNATYALLMFLIGSGVWLLDARPETRPADSPATTPRTDQDERADAGPSFQRSPRPVDRTRSEETRAPETKAGISDPMPFSRAHLASARTERPAAPMTRQTQQARERSDDPENDGRKRPR
ncbi:MAG: hypothetical protein AAF498_09295 [Pseudomonadota bacterium]